MSRKLFRIRAVVQLIAAVLAVAGPSAARQASPAGAVRIGGTGAGAAIMQMIGAAYERSHPGRPVLVAQGLGSTGGIHAVAKGALDIGVTSRPLRPDEIGSDVISAEFAITPVVLAVGRSSGVTGLTMDEVARIYRGEMTRWPNGEHVRLVLRPRSYNESAIVHALSPELSRAIEVAFARPGMIMAMTEEENIDILQHTPGAIGFTSLVQIRAHKPAVTVLAIDSLSPLGPRGLNLSYPFRKHLYIVAPSRPSPAAARFLAFLRSRRARSIIEQAGAVPASWDGEPAR